MSRLTLVDVERSERQMRAGDADRQAVAERLQGALNEGRIDLHEYDERLQRAYAAKTYAELDELLTDLPGTIPAERAQVVPFASTAPAPAYPNVTWRWLANVWDGYFGVVAVCVAIWLVICVMTGDLQYFWPGWVAGPWGAVLVVQTVGGLASGEPRKWAEKKARKAADRAEKKARERAEREDDEDD